MAARRLHPVRLTLREPPVDALNLYLCEASGLLRRQHLAVDPTDGAVRGHILTDDSLLLEKGDLNSSLYRGHGVVVKSAIFLPAAFFERGETTR